MITFEYEGKIYKPSNLENKLKKLGITINDIKIIDDTKTNTEKEKEERLQQNNIINSKCTVDVYWDNKCKGWYIVDDLFPYSLEWSKQFLKDIQCKRYKAIGYNVNKNNLQEFLKENYQKVIK